MSTPLVLGLYLLNGLLKYDLCSWVQRFRSREVGRDRRTVQHFETTSKSLVPFHPSYDPEHVTPDRVNVGGSSTIRREGKRRNKGRPVKKKERIQCRSEHSSTT